MQQFEHTIKNGQSFVLVPEPFFRDLLSAHESRSDTAAFDAAKTRWEAAGRFAIPLTVIQQCESGVTALKAWRIERGLTQQQLAEKSHVTRTLIARIETGSMRGGVDTLKSLASALEIPLEQLVD